MMNNSPSNSNKNSNLNSNSKLDKETDKEISVKYLVKIKKDVPPPKIDYKHKIQTGEVQNIGWFSYDECMSLIRHYDIAKKQVIKNVYNNLLEMKNNYVCCNFYYTGKKIFRTSPRKMMYYKNNTYQNFTGSKSL